MNDLRRECFEEAKIREANFADALSMSRTRAVGDTLANVLKAPDDVIDARRIDSRQCFCCGARWGRCEHTSEEAE